jgi:hypothetical protein
MCVAKFNACVAEGGSAGIQDTEAETPCYDVSHAGVCFAAVKLNPGLFS